MLILSLDSSVLIAESGRNDVCLFVCSVVVVFLGFRPLSYDSVASCLGSMIKDGVLLVEHLCLKKYETAN